MNKHLAITLITIGLVSCAAKDEHYYRIHPKELQHSLKQCPAQQPGTLSCEQLQQLGERLNSLAYQLQSNPQGFGIKILSLQESIAQQEQILKKDKTHPKIKSALAKNKHDLADCLAVVKWLESPES